MAPPRHVTVVVRDLPDEIAQVRGTAEQQADEDQVAINAVGVSIRGGWGRPVKSGNTPPLRAWGFWVTQEDTATRAQLRSLEQANVAKVFIGPTDGGPHPTWKQDVGWIDRAPAVRVVKAVKSTRRKR